MNPNYLVALFVVFLAVVGGVFALSMWFFRGRNVESRLSRIAERKVGSSALDEDARRGASRERLASFFSPFSRFAQSDDKEEVGTFRAKFFQAGYRSSTAPVIFFGLKAMLTFVFPVLGFFAIRSMSLNLPINTTLAVILVLAALGYYLPSIVLSSRRAERKREIFEAFPDATDLILVCVEAGLGLDAAIARAGAEIKLRSATLAEELNLVSLELRVGSTRERALRNLATRTGVEEVATFSAMIVQADRFGTSIADSLRVIADMLRTKRRLRAEEQAAKIPLKMLMPLIFCVFPALMVVLMGPAVIQVYRVILPVLGGR